MSKTHIIPEKAPMLFGATKAGQHCRIQIDRTGTCLDAKYLGSGRFTTVYSYDKHVILYTFHGDASKSILAQAHREQKRNPHLPRITKLSTMKVGRHVVSVYEAKRYGHCVRNRLNEANKWLVQSLQTAQKEAQHEFPYNIVRAKKCHDFNEFVVREFRKEAAMFPEGKTMAQALETLMECADDWGEHYIFDSFHVRNLGTNGDKLVLIDPMFHLETLQKDHNARQRRPGFSLAEIEAMT